MPVRKLQIRKFLILIRKSQISTKYCKTHNSPKILFLFEFYYVQILNKALYAIFLSRKSMYLRTCGNVKSANHKKLAPQIANPKSVTFAEGPQICGFAIFGTNLLTVPLWYLPMSRVRFTESLNPEAGSA